MNIDYKWIAGLLLFTVATGPAVAADADPGAGKITDGVYSNPYFGISIPLPEGYVAGFDPAPPSGTGYYVLSTPSHPGSHGPVILIAAQDMFFEPKPWANALAMATDLQSSAAKPVQPEIQSAAVPEPASAAASHPVVPGEEVTLGGHSFARAKTSGVILSHLVLATDIRCHIVSINLTANNQAALDLFATVFDKISAPPEASATTDGAGPAGSDFPVCIKDYANDQTVVHQVRPRLGGPKFVKIPVRIIIGKDGKVEHVHVIRAPEDDTASIEEALMKWEFKPHLVNGEPVEVETGLTFENR
jgi:hypothetical protein